MIFCRLPSACLNGYYIAVCVSITNHTAGLSGKHALVLRAAANQAEKLKAQKYAKYIANFDAKRRHLWFAGAEIRGGLGREHHELIKLLATSAYPLADGKYDVDGLNARAKAQLRQRISVGIVKGAHAVLASWRRYSWVGEEPEVEDP